MKRSKVRWRPKRRDPEHDVLMTVLIGSCVVFLAIVVGMAASDHLGWHR